MEEDILAVILWILLLTKQFCAWEGRNPDKEMDSRVSRRTDCFNNLGWKVKDSDIQHFLVQNDGKACHCWRGSSQVIINQSKIFQELERDSALFQ